MKTSTQIQTETDSGGFIAYPYTLATLKDIREPFHDRCIALKATTAVGLGYYFTRPGTDTVVENYTPPGNADETFEEVILSCAIDFEQTGNIYLEVVRTRGGKIGELYWLPAETMWKKKIRGRKNQGYVQRITGKVQPFVPFGSEKKEKGITEVLHIRQPNAYSRHYGLPDWLGAAGTIIMANNATAYNVNFFANNATPDWALIISGQKVSTALEQKIRDFIETNYKGIDNARKMLYLNLPKSENVNIEFKQLSNYWTKEGDFMRLLSTSRDTILSNHGVPPRLVGVVVSGHLGGGSEAHEQLKIFKFVTVNPRQRYYEKILNATIFAEDEVEIHFNELQIFDDEEEGEVELLPLRLGGTLVNRGAVYNGLQVLKGAILGQEDQ